MTTEIPNRIEDDEDALMQSFTRHYCCCRPTWERLRTSSETAHSWWAAPVRAFKKVREWSELAAGPKWKTFIRRCRFFKGGRSRAAASGGGNGGNGGVKFQYDPLSYSLNFDEGRGKNENLDEGYGIYPDFAMRFVGVPSSCKSSMDLGKGFHFNSSVA